MSTFLQLAQKLRQEIEIPGTGPTAVTGQLGQLKRVVDWTRDAYRDIQVRHMGAPMWRWLRGEFTFDTVIGDDTYLFGELTDDDTGVAIARFSRWMVNDVENPPRAHLKSGGIGGQYRLVFLPWHYYKQIYRIGIFQSSSPIHITVDPKNRLLLGPKPSDVYVVKGDYLRSAQILAADGDVPEMPSDYHELIVYWAMRKYGANAVAAELLARANTEGMQLMRALEANQLPMVDMAEPLA